jgi:hypothetical protein
MPDAEHHLGKHDKRAEPVSEQPKLGIWPQQRE